MRYLDGEPFLTNDSHFPLAVAQGTPIMTPDGINQGANRALADAGHVQVHATVEFTVRMPTPSEVGRLDLAPGTTMPCQITTGYDRDNQPLRVAITILPGDRHVIIYNRPGMPDPSEENSQ